MNEITDGRRIALAGIVTFLMVDALVCIGAAMSAHADDRIRIGNGAHNKNAVSIRSPRSNRDQQDITNANAGGRVKTRAAFCAKKRYCKIIQW